MHGSRPRVCRAVSFWRDESGCYGMGSGMVDDRGGGVVDVVPAARTADSANWLAARRTRRVSRRTWRMMCWRRYCSSANTSMHYSARFSVFA
ncbi:hypothetical protein C5E45_20715 [Nocardia nova]|uniref:Uncharacterized protein n=1 Tax=Nocardia nova TaxID=37330 RepID=A0A2S6AMM4_9NOCA|nr:hypothetical protein C5E45_20715 [Nocardia nova]